MKSMLKRIHRTIKGRYKSLTIHIWFFFRFIMNIFFRSIYGREKLIDPFERLNRSFDLNESVQKIGIFFMAYSSISQAIVCRRISIAIKGYESKNSTNALKDSFSVCRVLRAARFRT